MRELILLVRSWDFKGSQWKLMFWARNSLKFNRKWLKARGECLWDLNGDEGRRRTRKSSVSFQTSAWTERIRMRQLKKWEHFLSLEREKLTEGIEPSQYLQEYKSRRDYPSSGERTGKSLNQEEEILFGVAGLQCETNSGSGTVWEGWPKKVIALYAKFDS